MHYRRELRHGDPGPDGRHRRVWNTNPSLAEFLERTKPGPGDCIDFEALHVSGYGWLRFDGKSEKAHRVSWILHHGSIMPGLSVLHKCHRPACVNPDHLYLGTQTDNMRDMARAGRQWKQRLSVK